MHIDKEMGDRWTDGQRERGSRYQTYVYTYVSTNIRINLYTYTHIHIHIYIYTYIYIYRCTERHGISI